MLILKLVFYYTDQRWIVQNARICALVKISPHQFVYRIVKWKNIINLVSILYVTPSVEA